MYLVGVTPTVVYGWISMGNTDSAYEYLASAGRRNPSRSDEIDTIVVGAQGQRANAGQASLYVVPLAYCNTCFVQAKHGLVGKLHAVDQKGSQ